MLIRVLDHVHDTLKANPNWGLFKANHSTVFKALGYGYTCYRSCKILQYQRIYSRFKSFTMLPKPNYVNNLSICDEYRSIQGSVVEAGTWKGGMIAGIAALLGNSRAYYLYDSFHGFAARH